MKKQFCFAALLAGILFCSFMSQSFAAVEPVSFSLEDVTKRVEERRGTWIGLKAEVELQFTSAEEQKASCKGTLLYHRLDEAIRLECYNPKNELVFIFKTKDREFELYLPSHKSVYQGNIFSLEDSPEIQSQLRAWDLYRAFKPMLIPTEGVLVDQAPEGMISLKIMRDEDTLSRSLVISNQGDIVSETYFSPDAKPSVEIKRGDIQKIVPLAPSKVEPAFPHQITINSHKETSTGVESFNTTVFNFTKLDFSAELQDKDFELVLPEDTRTLVLEDSPS